MLLKFTYSSPWTYYLLFSSSRFSWFSAQIQVGSFYDGKDFKYDKEIAQKCHGLDTHQETCHLKLSGLQEFPNIRTPQSVRISKS